MTISTPGITVDYKSCHDGRRWIAVAMDDDGREIAHSVIRPSRHEAMADLTRKLRKKGVTRHDEES